MKILIAAACACVIAVTGYYFIGEFRTARHNAECDHLISLTQGYGYLVDHGDVSYRAELQDTANDMVAAKCDWKGKL